MAADSIQIGKFTLESLTTGMYSEPEACYREYIQNAVDSFDEAIAASLMKPEECRIEIIVNNDHRVISIKDNGVGIRSEDARRILLDIGNSTKLHTANRGFRGIGRLGGLSYCKKLSFCTSAHGENVKSIVTFDCEKLRALLVPGKNSGYDLQRVIAAVTDIEILEEQRSTHYFIVKMEDVDDIATLLDIDIVRDYISQVAPVPFRDRFFWGKQIKEELASKGFLLSEYPIFIGNSFESLSQVFKPYKLTLEVSARAGVTKDEIYALTYFEIKDRSENLLAVGWYADTDFSGTLADDKLYGIRVRQGNILIGNSRTLSPYFKESRFNGWSMGELYVLSDKLIPNARRDDFERNDTFSEFEAAIRASIGTEIAEKIRAASKKRNNPMQKTLDKTSKAVARIETVLETGFNSSFEKEQIAKSVEDARKDLYFIPKNAPEGIAAEKTALMGKLAELAVKVDESKKFRTKTDIPSDFSKAEKKVIQAMMEVLTRNFERDTVNSLYNEFLAELKLKGKK